MWELGEMSFKKVELGWRGMVSTLQKMGAGRFQVWFYKPETPSCLA